MSPHASRWLLLATLLATSQASAQVNIEKLRQDEDVKGLATLLGIDLSLRTGNVELVEFGVRGRMDYVGDAITTFLLTSGDFRWKNGEQFTNEAVAHVRQVYRGRSRVRPEVFAQVNYDRSRLLTFRGLLGGGARVRLYNSGSARLWLGSTYMFEHERLDLGTTAVHAPRTSVHRWSNYLTTRVAFAERATLAWTAYIQPQFDDFEDVRVLTEGSVGVELGRVVSLVTTFRLRYDSRPPDGKDRLDTKLSSGIEIAL